MTINFYENYKCTYQYKDKAEACVDAHGECEICKYYKKICPIIKEECSQICEDCFILNEYSEILNCFDEDDDIFTDDCDYYEDKYGNLIAVIDYDIDDLPF